MYQCVNCQFVTSFTDDIMEHQSVCKANEKDMIATVPIGAIPKISADLFKNSTESIVNTSDSLEMFVISSYVENELKEYQCPHCPHATNRAHALSKHINSMHTKAVWFHCDYCQYRSTDRSCLRRHVKNLHIQKGSLAGLSCDQCVYQCSTEEGLRRHRLNHESAVLQCPFCSYSSKDRSNFRKHLFIHNQAEYHCNSVNTLVFLLTSWSCIWKTNTTHVV